MRFAVEVDMSLDDGEVMVWSEGEVLGRRDRMDPRRLTMSPVRQRFVWAEREGVWLLQANADGWNRSQKKGPEEERRQKTKRREEEEVISKKTFCPQSSRLLYCVSYIG